MTEYDVFLSHDSRDKIGFNGEFGWVIEFAAALKKARVSYFLDRDRIAPGAVISETVCDALQTSSALVVFVSHNTIDNLKREQKAAQEPGLPKSWVYAELEFFLLKMSTSRKGELSLFLTHDIENENELSSSSLFNDFFEHFDSQWKFSTKTGTRVNPLAQRVSLKDRLWIPRFKQEKLVKQIRSDRNLRKRRQRVKVPEALEYNANRVPQRTELGIKLREYRDDVSKSACPVICIAVGDNDQCHEKFLRCFREFNYPDVSEQASISWPKQSRDSKQFIRQLVSETGSQLARDAAATQLEIHQQLALRPCPTFIRVQLSLETYVGAEVHLEDFFALWTRWGSGSEAFTPLLHPTVVLLEIAYPRPKAGLLGRFSSVERNRKKLLAQIDTIVSKCENITLLAPLVDIHRDEVTTWGELPEVKEVNGGRDLSIELDELYKKRNALPMKELAYALREIMKEGSNK